MRTLESLCHVIDTLRPFRLMHPQRIDPLVQVMAALLGLGLAAVAGCTSASTPSKSAEHRDGGAMPGDASSVAVRDGAAAAQAADTGVRVDDPGPVQTDAQIMGQADATLGEGGAPHPGVGPDYVFTPCDETGPECPCPRGEPWPWPAFMPEPAMPSLYCTPDGKVASVAVKPSQRIPVTCASVCLAFSLASGSEEYHGLCDQFGEDSQLCVEECTREWTPEEICCRAERVSSQKPGVTGVGQFGVPGFLSCGSDEVNSHYSCGQMRRPEDPFFLERYAACGAMGGRRY